MSLVKRKKRPQISGPSNFVHRVHTLYDWTSRTWSGLPRQWACLVTTPAPSRRPAPIADPRHITATGSLELGRDRSLGRSIVRSNSLRRPQPEFDEDSLEAAVDSLDMTNSEARHFYPGLEEEQLPGAGSGARAWWPPAQSSPEHSPGHAGTPTWRPRPAPATSRAAATAAPAPTPVTDTTLSFEP